MDTLIIVCAKYLIVAPVALTLFALYRVPAHMRIRRAAILFAALALTYVLGTLVGHFYFDPRPFVVQNAVPLIPHAADNGFPSDHTLLAAGLASAALYFDRRIALWLFALAVIIGAARVLALIHHPTDIIGSMVIALIAAWVVERSQKRFA